MNTEQLSARLSAIAEIVRPSANRYAAQETVRSVLKIIEVIPADEFAQMRAALYESPPSDFQIEPLPTRLRNLHHRMEADGRYVDANIVWLALQALPEAAA